MSPVLSGLAHIEMTHFEDIFPHPQTGKKGTPERVIIVRLDQRYQSDGGYRSTL